MPRYDRNGVDREDEAIIRREGVHAVRNVIGLDRCPIGRQGSKNVGSEPDESAGHPYQARCESAQPVRRDLASPVRTGDENDPPDFRPMKEDELTGHDLPGLGRERHLGRRFAKICEPQLVTRIRDEQSADAAAHAMADYDHRFAERILLFDAVEFGRRSAAE